MSFRRQAPPKPPRAMPTRSSIPLATPARMWDGKPRAVAQVLAPAKKASRAASGPEKAHMGRVAALGCLLCGQPAEVHHIREGQGMAQRASNWLTVPLCHDHHRGPRGVHGDRSALRALKLEDLDLLAQTIERLSTT